MLFESPENLTPAGIFSLGHLILLLITIVYIIIALHYTRNLEKKKVKIIIQRATIILWVLEIIKIIYTIINYGTRAINKYVPLYFCSLILYMGICSGFCKGTFKKAGDVFLSTGGIIAGIVFLIYPLTSLTAYPALHFISLQSFALHGTMLYIGILMLVSKYTIIEKKDFIYYFLTIVVISGIAYLINIISGSNLMFISHNYPGTYIEVIYNSTGKLFPIVMILAQAILPFYVVFGIYKIVEIFRDRSKKIKNQF